jgi:hypothetical protein
MCTEVRASVQSTPDTDARRRSLLPGDSRKARPVKCPTKAHHLGVELFEGGHDFREVAGERALLPGLQGNLIGAPVGDAAEAVELGLIGVAVVLAENRADMAE